MFDVTQIFSLYIYAILYLSVSSLFNYVKHVHLPSTECGVNSITLSFVI